jgi:Saccharopine dehydrogenase NADP binding domain
MGHVLIIGGYGNFGARIAATLLKNRISVVVAGRDLAKANALRDQLITLCNDNWISTASFDAQREMDQQLSIIQPSIVINTAGPFQGKNYAIAEACIKHKIHYIDLADARDYVTGITRLSHAAKENDTLVVSGASTVPALSAAVMDHYQPQFQSMESLKYGISVGQKTPRGLATSQAILSYLGKPLREWGKDETTHYGWQDLYRQEYPGLGKRWMANCEIPDLDLFIQRYHLKKIQFSAGFENGTMHLGMWAISHLVRMGVPLDANKHTKYLLKFSNVFDRFGSEEGGMHMLIRGINTNGEHVEVQWFILAMEGSGPQIPCTPAVILVKKLLSNQLNTCGAMPCVGLITLEEYMQELKGLPIKTHEFINKLEK